MFNATPQASVCVTARLRRRVKLLGDHVEYDTGTIPGQGRSQAARTNLRRFYFSIDVDYVRGSDAGLIALYEFCDRMRLAPTLFITGLFAVEYAELIAEAGRRGYQLGTHGWRHDAREDYRSAPYCKQRDWIRKATDAVHRASGVVPAAFRAPNLWIGETTFQVLEEEGYRVDSSVPSGRVLLGYGRANSLRYARAPLAAYHPCRHDLGRRGDSSIVEIPPSAMLVPINMSALRVFGLSAMCCTVRCLLRISPILVFYVHPAEMTPRECLQLPAGEPRRHRAGLGPHNFAVLEQFVRYVLHAGYAPAFMQPSVREPCGAAA
jgi:hypothetical protein